MVPDLMLAFRKQAEKFGTKFVAGKINSLNDIKAKAIIITTGAKAKWLGIESEQRLRGKGVSACATCDAFFFKNKIVAVVGGGDAALEEANFLTKFASKVYVIHRRDQFRASKFMQDRALSNPKIEPIYNEEILEVLGTDKVEGLKLKNRNLVVDGLFLGIGHEPETGFLKNSGVLLDEKGYILTTERVRFENKAELFNKFNLQYRYATSVPGIFAAGDCVDHVYRQAGTAVGMAIAAELEVEKYLENLPH